MTTMGGQLRGIKELSVEQVQLLKERFPPLTYHAPVELFYEGHIPNAVFLIVEGKVLLFKRKKYFHEIGNGKLLGIEELIHKSQIKFCARVKSNSKVSILAKSDLLSILADPSDELFPLMTSTA